MELRRDEQHLKWPGIDLTFESGLNLQMRLERERWERAGWRGRVPDWERGSGQRTVPKPPGSAAPLWQRVVQRQEGVRAEADSGGGAAG